MPPVTVAVTSVGLAFTVSVTYSATPFSPVDRNVPPAMVAAIGLSVVCCETATAAPETVAPLPFAASENAPVAVISAVESAGMFSVPARTSTPETPVIVPPVIASVPSPAW